MRTTSTLLSIAVLAGCMPSDPPETKEDSLGELSHADVTYVCTSVRDKMKRLEKAFVSVVCTDTAPLDDSCEAERAACIADPPEDVLLGDATLVCGTDTRLSITDRCPDLTVAQLESCLEATVKNLEKLAAAYTCSDDAEELDDDVVIKECEGLEDVCPELADLGAV